MSLLDQIGSSLASGVSSFVGGLPVSGFNMLMNHLGMNQQMSSAKEMMDYQWDKFGSPKAQVNALAAAGINPAVALGQGGTGAFAQPLDSMPSSVPVQIDNVAPMLSSLTQLKKVDKDNELVDQQIYKTLSEKNLIDEQRHGQNIANIILREYGDKEAAARIANLGGQTALYAAEKDFTKANESLIKLKQDTEKVYKVLLNENKLKAALEVKNYQRYIDSVIVSNQKSANLAEKQADFQQIVNEIKESGKTFELENLIRKYQAENKVSDASAEQAYTMLERYKQLNENDKNAAAKYLNYMFWFIKEQMPNLPVVPFFKVGK